MQTSVNSNGSFNSTAPTTTTQLLHDDCLRVVIYFLCMMIVPHRVPGGLKHWIGWRI